MSNYEFGPLDYGDLCPACRNDVVAEGEDFCASCLEEVEAYVLVDVDPGDESRAA